MIVLTLPQTEDYATSLGQDAAIAEYNGIAWNLTKVGIKSEANRIANDTAQRATFMVTATRAYLKTKQLLRQPQPGCFAYRCEDGVTLATMPEVPLTTLAEIYKLKALSNV